MKHILILSFYYTPDLCAGSFRTAALIETLQPLAKLKNIHIDLITTMPNRYHQLKEQAKTHEEHDHLSIYRIPLPSHQSGFVGQANAFTKYFFQARKLIKKNRKQYDCVFATSSRLFTAFLGATVSKKCRAPLFLDMRDIFTETMESILPKPLKILFVPLFQQIEQYTLNQASAINLVSPGFTSYFTPKLKSTCQLSHISNGIDACFTQPKMKKRNPNNPITILYAGNIGEGQGIEKIIPALAKKIGNQCLFRIIGGGGRLPALQSACANIDNVQIIAPMPRAQLITEYENADILFLHLNNYPAFLRVLPSKIFEYVMMGKPILAGVPGYSSAFLSQHVPWCKIFSPCDLNNAYLNLNKIISEMNSDKVYDTDGFFQAFNREKLMEQLSEKIIETV